MDIWDEIKKLQGYQSGYGGVDSYGVDHSGFSTRDELEYQNARLNRENQLAQHFSQMGIAQENYPQFGTNFWGGSAENNYGFGTSNIKQNIENVTNQLNNSGIGGGVNSDGFNAGANNGQVFANSDYTVNTESLVGKPSSYFQNNNTSDWNNTGGFGGNTYNGFNANTNNILNNYGYSGYGLQLQPTILTTQGTQYAQMVTPNIVTDANNSHPVDYSLYGDDFSREFIDQMLGDARFQQIMRYRTQGNEGGYSNNSNDRGGETQYGISSRWYPDEDIPNLTRERANALLYRDYWLAPHINQLPDEFADIVFDNSVVQGQPSAIRNLQRALGIQVDGIIGPDTLNAISNADENVRRNFIREVHRRNQNIVEQDPTQRVFLNGWTNRANNY